MAEHGDGNGVTAIGRFEQILFSWRFRGLTVFMVITLALACISLLGSIRLDPASHGVPAHRDGLTDLRKAGWPESEIALKVHFSEDLWPDGLWTAPALATLARIEEALAAVPGVDPETIASILSPAIDPVSEVEQAAINEVAALSHPPVINGAPAQPGSLRQDWSTEQVEWLKRLSTILKMNGVFVSPEGRTAVLRVLLEPATDSPRDFTTLAAELERLKAAAIQGQSVSVAYEGFPVRMGQIEQGARRGWPWLLAGLGGALVLAVILAQAVLPALAFGAAVLTPLLWTIGVMTLAGQALDPVALSALAACTAVSVILGMLILTGYIHQLSWSGSPGRAASRTLSLGWRLAAGAGLAGFSALGALMLLPTGLAWETAAIGAGSLLAGLLALGFGLPLMLACLPVGEGWIGRLGDRADRRRQAMQALFRRAWTARPGMAGYGVCIRAASRLLAVCTVLAGTAVAVILVRPADGVHGPVRGPVHGQGGQTALLTSGLPAATGQFGPDTPAQDGPAQLGPTLAQFGFFADSYGLDRGTPVSCSKDIKAADTDDRFADLTMDEMFTAVAAGAGVGPTSVKDGPGWRSSSPVLRGQSFTARIDHLTNGPCGSARILAGGLKTLDGASGLMIAAGTIAPNSSNSSAPAAPQGSAPEATEPGEDATADENGAAEIPPASVDTGKLDRAGGAPAVRTRGSLAAQTAVDEMAVSRLWLVLPLGFGLVLAAATLALRNIRVAAACGVALLTGLAFHGAAMTALALPAGHLTLWAGVVALMAGAASAVGLGRIWLESAQGDVAPADALLIWLERAALPMTMTAALLAATAVIGAVMLTGTPGLALALVMLGLVCHALSTLLVLPATLTVLSWLSPEPSRFQRPVGLAH